MADNPDRFFATSLRAVTLGLFLLPTLTQVLKMCKSEQTRQINSYIAKQVLTARTEIGLSRSDLSNLLNIGYRALYDKEQEQVMFRAAELAIIAQATGKPIGWFFPPGES